MNREDSRSQKSHLDTFVLSLDRCLGFEAFIPAFYSAFLRSSDEVAQPLGKLGADLSDANDILHRKGQEVLLTLVTAKLHEADE